MAQVVIHVGGNDYRLACRDGEEPRLEKLGQYLDRKAEDLQQSLGQVSETRLLLMAALLVVDELVELRERQAEKEDGTAEAGAAPASGGGIAPETMSHFLQATLTKVTAISDKAAPAP